MPQIFPFSAVCYYNRLKGTVSTENPNKYFLYAEMYLHYIYILCCFYTAERQV